MFGSIVVYAGGIVACAGAVLGLRKHRNALRVSVAGVAISLSGVLLPTRESRVDRAETRLDELTPAWQLREVHTLRIDAPPARVYDAIKSLRAGEIRLFHTLTWIRRGGREMPENILNPGAERSLLDIATHSGFIYLADEPNEVVIATIVVAPPDRPRLQLTPELFRSTLAPGFALAAMNFRIRPDGDGSVRRHDRNARLRE